MGNNVLFERFRGQRAFEFKLRREAFNGRIREDIDRYIQLFSKSSARHDKDYVAQRNSFVRAAQEFCHSALNVLDYLDEPNLENRWFCFSVDYVRNAANLNKGSLEVEFTVFDSYRLFFWDCVRRDVVACSKMSYNTHLRESETKWGIVPTGYLT